MLCQRCGLCCFTMDVAILVDADDGLKVAWKPGGQACPHLSFEDTQAGCAVHARPEFKGSPCWTYGNSDADPDFAHRKGKPCRVGELIQQGGGCAAIHPGVSEPTRAQDLEVLGPWDSSYPLEG